MTSNEDTRIVAWQMAVATARPGTEQERLAIRGCARAARDDPEVMGWLRAHPAYTTAADELAWEAARAVLEAAVERDDGDAATYAGVAPLRLAPLLRAAARTHKEHALRALLDEGAAAPADVLQDAVAGNVSPDALNMLLLRLSAAVIANQIPAADCARAVADARAAAVDLPDRGLFTILNAVPAPQAPAAPVAPPAPPKKRGRPPKAQAAPAAPASPPRRRKKTRKPASDDDDEEQDEGSSGTASPPRKPRGRPPKNGAPAAAAPAATADIDEEMIAHIRRAYAPTASTNMSAFRIRTDLAPLLAARNITGGSRREADERTRDYIARAMHAALGVSATKFPTGLAYPVRPVSTGTVTIDEEGEGEEEEDEQQS